MTENEDPTTPKQEVSTEEVLGWLEFACWTMLALMPMLYYVNGSAVSTDQLVMRSVLVTVSTLGAVGLCFRRWRIRSARRRDRHSPA